MTLADVAIGSIVHDQERDTILYIEVKHADDMRMLQVSHDASFFQKIFLVSLCQGGQKHFDRGLRLQASMLTKIDFCEASAPQKPNQAIVAKLLADTVPHFGPPCRCNFH